MENNKKSKKVYVVGHRNPDTDSICSALAYANLKNQISKDEYIAKRAGQMNEETQFVLKRFGVDAPRLLSNVHLQVKDMDVKRMEGIKSSTSIKKAWEMMKEEKVHTMPITRNHMLEGVITTGDIATSYMDVYDNKILAMARTQYQNIVDTLEGEVVTGNPHAYFIKGKVAIAASSPDLMESFIEKDDLVILGNRYESQLCAIEMDASCLVICRGAQVAKTIKKLAEERSIVIITTPHDAFTAARLINQSIPVKYFMSKDNLTVFNTTDYVEPVKETMTKKRFRDFPVVDRKGHFYGLMSRRRLLDACKKQLILVDHNEKSQAVEGIEEAEILEIIDHHRLGSLETVGPVYFRNQPVGCTATIVYQMYKEKHVELEQKIAALLCSAIISDTLMFRSPTCTAIDRVAAGELAEIARINIEELAQDMFQAGSNLRGKSAEEICFQDFKRFNISDVKFGVGQINFMSNEELQEIKTKLNPYLKKVLLEQKLDMIFFMMTNIIKESTELLCCGEGAKEMAGSAFDLPDDTDDVVLEGVVSRKKQLIPAFAVALQQ